MQLGDYISFEKDGVIHTQRIEYVKYDGGVQAVFRRLNRWQRIGRRLTPPRWRKDLLVRAAEPPSFTINGDADQVGKTLAQIERMKAAFDALDNLT